MKLAGWQKAGVVIAGLTLLWGVISFLISFSQSKVPATAGDKTDKKSEINASKIYLSLWETSREIALNQDKIVVPPIYPIKINEEFVFRVILRQENEDGVYIPYIHITFPDTAEVVPDTSDINRAGVWTKNNDIANTYYLGYLNTTKFYPEMAYNLPAFRIKVKDAKMPMSYRITVDGLSKAIRRDFVIDTSLDYNTYYKEHFSLNTAEQIPTVSGDTSGVLRRVTYAYDEKTQSTTASSACVSINPRSLTFTYPLETIKPDMQKSDTITVPVLSHDDSSNSVTPFSAPILPTVTQDADVKQ